MALYSCALDVVNFLYGNRDKIYIRKDLLKLNSEVELEEYILETGDYELKYSLKIAKKYMSFLFVLYKVFKAHFYYFKDRQHDVDLYLTTAHTAKGLEWDQVEVANDFIPVSELILNSDYTDLDSFANNMSDIKAETINEINLLYVTVTRAKNNLVYKNCEALQEALKQKKELHNLLKDKL